MIPQPDLKRKDAKAELAKSPQSRRELAFQTVLKNRTAHGGILAAGAGVLKHGENGKGILSRWYPQTIAKRITNIEFVIKRLEFIHGNAFGTMTEYRKDEMSELLIDRNLDWVEGGGIFREQPVPYKTSNHSAHPMTC